MEKTMSWLRRGTAMGLVLSALAGCAQQGRTAGAQELEKAAVSAVKASEGLASSVDCKGASLKVEKGESAQCSITIEGESTPRSAAVSVASVSAQGYGVDVAITPALKAPVADVPVKEVQAFASNGVKAQTKASAEVSCVNLLPRAVGSTSSCTALFPGEKSPRTAAVKVVKASADGTVETSVALKPSLQEKPLSEKRSGVAAVVASALEKQLGAIPAVSCGDGYAELRAGAQLSCSVTSAEGAALGDAQVTLRGVSGAAYSVDVSLEQKN